jgi:hypothetical protein
MQHACINFPHRPTQIYRYIYLEDTERLSHGVIIRLQSPSHQLKNITLLHNTMELGSSSDNDDEIRYRQIDVPDQCCLCQFTLAEGEMVISGRYFKSVAGYRYLFH